MNEGEMITTKHHLYTRQKDGTFHGTPIDITGAILRDVEADFIVGELVAGDTITTRGKDADRHLYIWTKKKDSPTSVFSAKRIVSLEERAASNKNVNTYGLTHDFCIYWKGNDSDARFFVSEKVMRLRSSIIRDAHPTKTPFDAAVGTKGMKTFTVPGNDLSLEQLKVYIEAIHTIASYKKTRWLREHEAPLRHAATFFVDKELLQQLKEASDETDDEVYSALDSTD